jgi:Adipocyte plasma membrane-associated protein-like, N-terminal
MRKGLLIAGAAIATTLAYLFAWPVPVDPVAWNAPKSGGYVGAHARNEGLAPMQLVKLTPEVGPEHIAFGPDGKLYTAMLSGAVLRMNADGSAIETLANTGGRPLGLDFDASGREEVRCAKVY